MEQILPQTPVFQSSPETQAYSDPSMTRWSFLNPYKKWLLVIGSLVLILVVMAAMLLTKTISIPNFLGTSSPTPTPTPTPMVDEAQQAFFATLPQSMLYYSFAQTSSGKVVYQSDPTDTNRRAIDIGLPGVFAFYTSPDGKWIIKHNDHQLLLSSAADPTHFVTLYSFPDPQLRLSSLKFQADSSNVAFTLSKTSADKSGLDTAFTNYAFITNISTTNIGQPTQILKADKSFKYKVVGLPDNQKLWYVEDRDGRISNLTKLNIATGQTDYQFTAFNQDNLVSTFQYINDMNHAYVKNESSVVEYDLTNQQSKTIYQLDLTCSKTKLLNPSTISSLAIDPQRPQLMISIDLKPCTNQPTPKAGDVIPPTQRTLIINTSDNQIIQQQDNQPVAKFEQSTWSPDGQHIWLTVNATTSYQLNLNPWQFHIIPTQDRTTISKEKVYFLGWLAATETK